MIHQFICSRCQQEVTHESDFSTGYGINDKGEKSCFACCGDIDRDHMVRDGKTTLYLTNNPAGTSTLSNWPGTLLFPLTHKWTGRHNFGGKVTYFRFIGPDKAIWSGRQMGAQNEIAHCRRTKLTTPKGAPPMNTNLDRTTNKTTDNHTLNWLIRAIDKAHTEGKEQQFKDGLYYIDLYFYPLSLLPHA